MADRYGMLGADSLTGTNTDDYISGGPLGNEAGDTGNDTLRGGNAGYDVIYGWGGNDSIVGSSDAFYDFIYGGDGNDTISIGYGNVYGEAGDDRIVSTSTSDGPSSYMVGGSGADTLLGGAAGDSLLDDNFSTANTDADSLAGGAGDDQLFSSGGVDTLDGGTGYDYATIDRSALTVGYRFTPTAIDAAYVASDGTAVVNIENLYVTGGSGDDTLSGLGDNDDLRGGAGNDSISGSSYGSGEAGDDTISVVDGYASGGDGDDRITGITATLYGDGGNDVLIATGAARMVGGAGADSLVGSASGDQLSDGELFFLTSDNAADTLLAGDGDDRLISGGGADSLDGGGGIDSALIYRFGLTANFSFKAGAATAISTASDGTRVTGVENFQLYGGSGRDKLTANAGTDYLAGHTGNDNLNGGKGTDYLDGGEGGDALIGGAGSDQMIGRSGADAFRWMALDRRNTDVIEDFGDGPDLLEFSTGALGGLLAPGALNVANFALDAATAAAPQFIYKTATDTLFWDADGTGSGKAVSIAFFQNNPTLSAADIVIIA